LAATYSDGTSSSLTNTGTYGLYLTEAVTLKASNSNVAYPNIWITLSGQVTLTYPDGTADTNPADYTGSALTFDETAGKPHHPRAGGRPAGLDQHGSRQQGRERQVHHYRHKG
jgi:hypothetical protein